MYKINELIYLIVSGMYRRMRVIIEAARYQKFFMPVSIFKPVSMHLCSTVRTRQ